jgi:methionine-rich copper-binding protein CopC
LKHEAAAGMSCTFQYVGDDRHVVSGQTVFD